MQCGNFLPRTQLHLEMCLKYHCECTGPGERKCGDKEEILDSLLPSVCTCTVTLFHANENRVCNNQGDDRAPETT